jgi:hypothetical protein
MFGDERIQAPRVVQCFVAYAAVVITSPLVLLMVITWLVSVVHARLVRVLEALVLGLWEVLVAMVKAIDELLEPFQRQGGDPPGTSGLGG